MFCRDCDRTKMLFETEKKANNFIKFNKLKIEIESGFSPERSYYCLFCGGWHLTSISEKIGLSKKEKMLEQFKKQETKNLSFEDKQTFIIKQIESQIIGMEPHRKEHFFSENISVLEKRIELLCNSDSSNNKNKLKELRQNLNLLYIVRKRNGFQKKVDYLGELREKKMEEYRLWVERKVEKE